ncbi:NAD(P)-dependent oxidoreductase [Acinetobacter nectaris]|uniref:NAD(P)-dependent oxidoreductase n=1 Tax=Acinetobacter nectaris TaxID=1219382 RepID=UPI001F1970B6|nr:NAD(P)-dependent oxidoreductase [Acinetobacter nectaris]MCF8998701.1 NAD(P)-dependent oxidoreductase [Acinetobacter nectaris]MCF9026385.1 NAD(P)-dependent oxidoreductase [Acinetobacter nectaris]
MTQIVSFIGLGAMGYRMAAHLPKHFSKVLVWNRTSNKAEGHAKTYGTQAVTLQEAVQADIIFSCLPTSADVEHLIQPLTIKSGAIWVDCTSGVPESAKKLEVQLKEKNVAYLDSPVSGQTIGAENATLTFMVGGNIEAFEKALPAMQALGKLIKHVGDSGAGFAVKAVNNMLMAVHLCAACEGASTLKSHGVNLQEAFECINASSGQSTVTSSVLPQRIFNRSFPNTFALPLLAKDTGIALDLVQNAKLSAPVIAASQSLIQAASNLVDPNSDFSTVAKMYEMLNKVTIE